MRQNVLLFLIIASFIAVAGCEKAEQKIKENLLTNLITENIWIVTRFDSSATSLATNFAPYEFKFNKDGSVNAVKAGATEATGTWLGSESGESITANFPTAAYPVNKLNGVWLVTNTDLSPKLVDSHRFAGATEYILRLNAK